MKITNNFVNYYIVFTYRCGINYVNYMYNSVIIQTVSIYTYDI